MLLSSFICFAQDFTYYNEFVYQMEQYGFIEYAMPIDLSYDTTISDYTDTLFCWVHLDSMRIDSVIAQDFNFFDITKNIWIAQTTYYDTLYTIDTLRQEVLLIYVIPEMSPNWIEDLFWQIKK